jgi:ABC-type nitrate/sulfonate/bicarbonate transport system substrate-binding protein
MLRRALALVAGLMLAWVPAGAQQPPKFTIQYVTPSITPQNWPTFVAEAQGYFAREGLAVDMVQIDPSTLLSAVIGGSSQIGLVDSAAVILAVDKGSDVVAIGSGADRVPYKFMTAPSVKTFKDLKGKVIGAAAPVEVYTTVIKQILKKGGLDPENDVQFVFGGGQNQRVAALLGGAIQGGLVTPPNDFTLAQKGFNSLSFIPDTYPNLQLSITVTKRSWAAQNPQVVRGYLKAMAEASRWLNNPANKDAALALLIAKVKTTPEAASESYDYYMTRLHEFPNDYCRIRPGMESVLNIIHPQGLTKSTAADVGKYTSTQWCPK